MEEKIGLGLITCNAPEKFKQSAITVPDVDEFVIVNDGLPYEGDIYPEMDTLFSMKKIIP